MSVAVGLQGVTKHFGGVVAVDNLDLDIHDGEFFSLLGPSGCGKTTTLRMVAGLELPTAGSVQIHGEEMGIRPPNKRPVNTVFQSYALFPHMDVARNVGFGLEMRKVDKAERENLVAWAINLVEMGGMAHRKPGQLSGGQQQRVALARALVNRPEVLLLDEPLGALDLKLRQQMQHELKELQREVGITFVYVTHDQEEAVTMSDRIGVMHDGRLLQVDTPETIYEHPTTRFVADFIGQTNFLEATVTAADEVVLANGDRLRLSTEHSGGTPVAVTVRPERLTVHGRGEAPGGTHR
ncbi:MAG TPA: ABC transporter ATP-binding protein, partial [Acidimicrobiales bacterium]|nr:ABC transporter ATP-binding protein [Acidimicrobiales bacterium]